MRIDLGDKKYQYRFQYGPSRYGMMTWCDIDKVDQQDGVEVKTTASTGWALCSVKDVFRKETGRKVALTRALKGLNLTKEERREVWQSYHNRKQR